jgi:hypothetical protein
MMKSQKRENLKLRKRVLQNQTKRLKSLRQLFKRRHNRVKQSLKEEDHLWQIKLFKKMITFMRNLKSQVQHTPTTYYTCKKKLKDKKRSGTKL